MEFGHVRRMLGWPLLLRPRHLLENQGKFLKLEKVDRHHERYPIKRMIQFGTYLQHVERSIDDPFHECPATEQAFKASLRSEDSSQSTAKPLKWPQDSRNIVNDI